MLVHEVCLWHFQLHLQQPRPCMSKLPLLGLKCIHEDKLEARVTEILRFGTSTLK